MADNLYAPLSEKEISGASAQLPTNVDNYGSLGSDYLTERYRLLGITPPEKDGFFGELWDSAMYSGKQSALDMATTLESFTGIESPQKYMEEVMRTSQYQAPYEGYEILSLDPVDIARTLGMGVGSSV